MTPTNESDRLRAELDSTRRRLCSHGVPFANCAAHRGEAAPEEGSRGASQPSSTPDGAPATDGGPSRESGARQ